MHERNELAQLLRQDIEKGLAFASQPFENSVELRGKSHALASSLPQGACPLWRPMSPACDPRSMREVFPSNSLGSASRTPDPKTASRDGQKNTILVISSGFPFCTMIQRVDRFTMIISVTVILTVEIFFITFLSHWI
jgi:hypothetical protein